MKRRDFLKFGALSLAAAGMGGLANAASILGDKSNKPPNFVFIVCDDLGWGDLNCFVNRNIKTPNLDKLAAQGTRFTQFYSASPVCSPSRTGMMTGLCPARAQMHYALSSIEGNKGFGMPNFLDPKLPTLPRLLKERGYRTGHFGKWHLGGPQDPTAPPPSAYGIDVSETYLSNGDKLPAYEKHESSERIIGESIKFIEQSKDAPFFVNVWLSDPHSLLAPSAEQMEEYSDRKTRAEGFSSTMQVYYSVITNMDKQVGKLMGKLDELGLADNTVVVFTSDNGPSPIWGNDTAHSGAGSAGPFRGVKASIYEGGIRMPMIVRWPGHVPANSVDDKTIWGGVDFLPTACAIAGANLPQNSSFDGVDASDALQGKPFEREKPLMWEYRFGPWGRHLDKSPALAMRDGRWKLLMNPDKSRLELYDVIADPTEVDNKAEDNPRIVRRMSAKLLKWHNALPGTPTMPKGVGDGSYPWPKSGDMGEMK